MSRIKPVVATLVGALSMLALAVGLSTGVLAPAAGHSSVRPLAAAVAAAPAPASSPDDTPWG
jgi:hypothetical protein